MAESNNILSRITDHYPDLSPTARLVANYLQQHPMALVTMSMSELASVTNSSKATVSRLFRQLGYDSHQEARQAFINMRSSGLPLPPLAQDNPDHIATELTNVQKSLEAISEQQWATIAENVVNARRIFVLGYRNSYPVALHCRQQLSQIRDDVNIMPQPGQSLGEELQQVTDKDLVILVGFRRRPKMFEQLIDALSDKNTLLITDPSGQIYNQKVTEILLCQLGLEFAFDSYAAPMSLVSVLCNKVFQQLGEKASQRASEISNRYHQLQEIELD